MFYYIEAIDADGKKIRKTVKISDETNLLQLLEFINLIPIKIKKLPNKEKDKFQIYPYLITAKIPSPKNFYEFIDNCKKYKNVIRVYFPIDFEKSNEEINLTFKIEVYKLKENTNILKKVLNES